MLKTEKHKVKLCIAKKRDILSWKISEIFIIVLMIELAFFGSLDELDKHQLCKLIAYRMSKHDIKQPLRFLLKWYNIFDLLEKRKLVLLHYAR